MSPAVAAEDETLSTEVELKLTLRLLLSVTFFAIGLCTLIFVSLLLLETNPGC